MTWVVITSIWEPSPAVHSLSKLISRRGWRGVMVADRKTPANWSSPGFKCLGIEEQKTLWGDLALSIPFDHYSRKNLGYLYALQQGADTIIEIDDDNYVYPDFGESLTENLSGYFMENKEWLNVYRYYTNHLIWPRGFALNQVRNEVPALGNILSKDCPIQQFLVDGDPDVDSIYRLMDGKPLQFEKNERMVLVGNGSWCPFNSQGTVYFRSAFPLLYLPCFATFRMTDIWRSFYAQLILQTQGKAVAYHPPGFRQERNPHDLVQDLKDEIPGYLNNDRLMRLLVSAVNQNQSPVENVISSLRVFVREGLLPEKEIDIYRLWSSQL